MYVCICIDKEQQTCVYVRKYIYMHVRKYVYMYICMRNERHGVCSNLVFYFFPIRSPTVDIWSDANCNCLHTRIMFIYLFIHTYINVYVNKSTLAIFDYFAVLIANRKPNAIFSGFG